MQEERAFCFFKKRFLASEKERVLGIKGGLAVFVQGGEEGEKAKGREEKKRKGEISLRRGEKRVLEVLEKSFL